MGVEKSDVATDSGDLVPVFMPPLAAILAHAETLKGARLEEAEVVRVRDSAICIMMTLADALKLAESRGYADVEPENCWADWHRLRVEFTGNGYLPKIVLCVLGNAEFERRCGPLLAAEGVEHEWNERDDRMMSAFQASAYRCDPSLTQADIANITQHSRVLYILSSNFTAQEGAAVSRRFLTLARRLFIDGATAVKCESSGVAHGRDRWIELADAIDGADPWTSLLGAYVQLPISDGENYYTCGLHLLGQPDLIASAVVLRAAYGSTEDPPWAAADLFRGFARYLLAECRPGQFGSGHSFSLSAQSPRFRVIWERCAGYEEDDFYFNPFGRWRFAEVI
jgi:hypothetical protein